MKLVVQIQLLPDAEEASQLQTTMERFNAAANHVAGIAFLNQTANVFELRRLCYHEVRERFGLSSQMAQLAIKVVSDAYKRDKTIPVAFRAHAAVPYDIRTMSFKGIDRVSLLTLHGRVLVPFILGRYQAERMPQAKGQCDLVLREDGKWFLIVTMDVPNGALIPVTDFLGVDLGLANIATDSDGTKHSGEEIETTRCKRQAVRKRVQSKGTKGARKRLKRQRRKEARFRRHHNHCISKTIVSDAKRTGRGIALEDLKGIRDRVTARGSDARHRLGGWAFGQLRGFIEYKAGLVGVPVEPVDPRDTSGTCAECGHCERANRKSQSEFSCRSCGHQANADVNAARNIRARAISKLALRTGDRA
jgi:IS605 OrfB family transposase